MYVSVSDMLHIVSSGILLFYCRNFVDNYVHYCEMYGCCSFFVLALFNAVIIFFGRGRGGIDVSVHFYRPAHCPNNSIIALKD